MAFLGDWTPAAAPGEQFLISASIANRLGADALAGVTGSVGVYQGVDPNAGALALTPATFNGFVVSQLLGGGWVPGVVYRWLFVVTTTGGRTLEFWAHISTQAIS